MIKNYERNQIDLQNSLNLPFHYKFLLNFYSQHNKLKIMVKRNSKWSEEEEQVLKQLKQEQIKLGVVDWEIISRELNSRFLSHVRTPPQCRQKYINHLKIPNRSDNYDEWTYQEFKILIELYQEYGSSWSMISSKLKKRSQNCIKNKFHNNLRKAANILYRIEKGNKSITAKILYSMLDFTYKFKKRAQELQLSVNEQNNLYRFRDQVLKFSIQPQSYSEEDLTKLIVLIKNVNMKIRGFGVFKKQKTFISDKTLLNFCQRQKLIENSIKQTSTKTEETQNKQITENEQSQQQFNKNFKIQYQEILSFYEGNWRITHQLEEFDQLILEIDGKQIENIHDNFYQL